MEDLPEYFSELERGCEHRLAAEVNAHRSQIQSAIDEIHTILKDMEGGEQKTEIPPKLEKIGRSALPQLIRSLRLHINRTLPDDPESYYREAAIMLKGCIEALRGAGKYLPLLFPEEMKALRTEIRSLGQSINAMTAVLEQLREEEGSLRKTKEAYQRLIALRQEREEHIARMHILEQEIRTNETEIGDIRQSLTLLPAHPDYEELSRQQATMKGLEEQLKEQHLQSERIHGTILTVFRRALRLTRRHEGKETPILLEQTIEILESRHPASEQVRIHLERSIPAITDLMKEHELIVKGQEEGALFGDVQGMVRMVVLNCEEREVLEQDLQLLQDRIQSSPLMIRKVALEKKEGQLSTIRIDLLRRREKEQEIIERFPDRENIAKKNLADAIAKLPGEIRWTP